MAFVTRGSVMRGVCVAVCALGACTKNETTGRNQLSFGGLSRDQEVAVGLSEGPKLTQEFGGEVGNPLLRAYVDEVGQKLKNQTEVDTVQVARLPDRSFAASHSASTSSMVWRQLSAVSFSSAA